LTSGADSGVPSAGWRMADWQREAAASEICGPGLQPIPLPNTTLCTIGDETIPMDAAVSRSVEPIARRHERSRTVACVGDGVSGNRFEVLYLYDQSRGSRLAQYRASFYSWIADADRLFDRSAQMDGGRRQLRFVTDADCLPEIRSVPVTQSDLRNFTASILAAQAGGYAVPGRNYLILGDATVYCGIGTVFNDSSPDPTNRNNVGGAYARVDSGCWGGDVIAHELMHNLGAVQLDAPNTTGAWHCTDEHDLMCYSDQGANVPPMRNVCVTGEWADREWFDCKNDDYFAITPDAASYIATHWNTANSNFLSETGGLGAVVSMSPASGHVGDEVIVSAENLTPGLSSHMFWDDVLLASQPVSDTGSVRYVVRVPEGAAGSKRVLVTANGNSAEEIFLVEPNLTVNPEKTRRGRYVSARITGFAAGERITIAIDGTVLAKVEANHLGSVTTTFAIPQTMEHGRATLVADGSEGNHSTTPMQIMRKHRRS
ncbi:MAG: hypothetical protein ACKOD2_05840, partial [Ilumatobacteraceae bacterium]